MSTIRDNFNQRRRVFEKQYLPGYTGFVPTKNDFFGMTAGEVNRTVVKNGGMQIEMMKRPQTGTTHAIGFYAATPTGRTFIVGNEPTKDVFGTRSRHAKNWIAGPTHEMCLQHIPGYNGHVQGVISENVHGISFAKATQVTIGHRNPTGADYPPQIRFRTTSRDEFRESNFRRIGKFEIIATQLSTLCAT